MGPSAPLVLAGSLREASSAYAAPDEDSASPAGVAGPPPRLAEAQSVLIVRLVRA